jgi:hypothetical protein
MNTWKSVNSTGEVSALIKLQNTRNGNTPIYRLFVTVLLLYLSRLYIWHWVIARLIFSVSAICRFRARSAASYRSSEELIKTVINVVCPPRIILNHFHLMDPWPFPPLWGRARALVWKISEQWWFCCEQDWHELCIQRRDTEELMAYVRSCGDV